MMSKIANPLIPGKLYQSLSPGLVPLHAPVNGDMRVVARVAQGEILLLFKNRTHPRGILYEVIYKEFFGYFYGPLGEAIEPAE